MTLIIFQKNIEADVREAYRVLRFMKSDGPPARLSAWPYVEYVPFGRGGRLTPGQISHMDTVLDKLLKLENTERVVLCGRALGLRWKMLEDRLGQSHTTLRKSYKSAVEKLYAVRG